MNRSRLLLAATVNYGPSGAWNGPSAVLISLRVGNSGQALRGRKYDAYLKIPIKIVGCSFVRAYNFKV